MYLIPINFQRKLLKTIDNKRVKIKAVHQTTTKIRFGSNTIWRQFSTSYGISPFWGAILHDLWGLSRRIGEILLAPVSSLILFVKTMEE